MGNNNGPVNGPVNSTSLDMSSMKRALHAELSRLPARPPRPRSRAQAAQAEAMLLEAMSVPRTVPNTSPSTMRQRLEKYVAWQTAEAATRRTKRGPGTPTPLLPGDIDAIVRGVNYKSSANVERALGQSLAWLKRSVGTRKYAIVTYQVGPRLKSNQWLAPRVVEAIGRAPEAVLPLMPVNTLMRRKDRLRDVDAFVYLDDASYSGSQLLEVADMFKDVRKAGGAAWEPKRLYMAVGFLSPVAEQTLREAREGLTPNEARGVELFAPGGMRTLEQFYKNLESANNLNNAARARIRAFMQGSSGGRLGGSVAILAHKVPNAWSIPGSLSRALDAGKEHYKVEPAFARRGMTPVRAYARNGTRYVVFQNRSGNEVHRVGYALDASGRLVARRYVALPQRRA